MEKVSTEKPNISPEMESITLPPEAMGKQNKAHPETEYLLAEYGAANDAYMHYDNFSWHVGAVLIAGTFVFWGFLIENNAEPARFFVGSILVAILMSAWMMYSSHNRQIYMCKLHRLHELEKILGFKQHSRWIDEQQKEKQLNKKTIYFYLGPPGHKLDTFIYAISALGAPTIGFFNNPDGSGRTIWPGLVFFSIVLMIIIVHCWVRNNEQKLKNYLKVNSNFD